MGKELKDNEDNKFDNVIFILLRYFDNKYLGNPFIKKMTFSISYY